VANVFVFRRLYPFSPPPTATAVAVFGWAQEGCFGPTCHLSALNYYCISGVGYLIIYDGSGFRGTQNEDDRGPFRIQSSLGRANG
jgi:hypothetical protein